MHEAATAGGADVEKMNGRPRFCSHSTRCAGPAMNPPRTGYLYFVAVDKEGHTKFATTEQEHAANIALAKQNGVL